MRPIILAAVVSVLVPGLGTPASAKVLDRVPESVKTLAVAAYTVRYCPSLKVDADVERDWLRFVGYDLDRPDRSEYEIRAVQLQINAYERDSTMTCAGIYLAYGPMGSVVNGMVDRAFFLNGMIDLY
ncbi:MAG TPA: hypothetical protein VH414_05200 [Lichenihabitans sp.]|nr:hypothetical protein [Lichenihabitans sp.]